MAKNKNEIENIDENEIATFAERTLGHLKPYASQLALGAAILFALFVGISYWFAWRSDSVANQWRDLNISRNNAFETGNSNSLTEVFDTYPDTKAGLWSLQMAGDVDLQLGLRQVYSDREVGMRQLKKAKENFQKVVDSPASLRSSELTERSLYSLAYACESIGEFEEAKQYYERVSENADSIYVEAAADGMLRCSNDTLIAAFDKFKNYTPGDAPGALVPDRPSLEVPFFDLEQLNSADLNTGGGTFDPSAGLDTTERAPRVTLPGNGDGGSGTSDPAPAPPAIEPSGDGENEDG